MKHLLLFIPALLLAFLAPAQSPQKMSYQAVVRNEAGKLMQNAPVALRLSILQGSPAGTAVYSETHSTATNVNGLVTLEIGTGTSAGSLATVNWTDGPFFLKSETDPAGGTNYSITGISELISVPYAFHAATVGPGGFSGDYNDLTNKPVTDGSETKIQAGTGISVAGTGTQVDPYVVSVPANGLPEVVTLTTTQVWTVPQSVSKIRVELWGGAGGGGGAGAYSYSYILNAGGDGGSGGYASKELNVTAGQQFSVVVGAGGAAGSNTWSPAPPYVGDTDGNPGGATWFDTYKAAGGGGGRKGSYSTTTVHGAPGQDNLGSVTAYADPARNAILNVYTGVPRSYLGPRFLGSKPGRGGVLMGYSSNMPTQGEAGAVVITLFD